MKFSRRIDYHHNLFFIVEQYKKGLTLRLAEQRFGSPLTFAFFLHLIFFI
jgi:hypothetical protein